MSLESEKTSLHKLFDPCDKIPDFQISDVTREGLCFREDLVVNLKDEFTSDAKPLGGYCISIESIGPNATEFMIQVLSSFNADDSFAGSKVIGSTTAKLHCLEEKRTEYTHTEDGLKEKILYIGLEDDAYHLEGQDICPCKKSTWQKDLPLCSTGEIISEGANVLLMRYLALKNFHGSLSFQSVMIGGQLTTCNYRCTEAQSMEFDDHLVEVYTIERRMHEECGLVHNTKTYMTPKGFILSHDWLEVPYLLKINSLIDPNELDHKKPRFIAPLRTRWSSDVQMLSMYLDKKTSKIAQQVEYLTDHPEIRQLISDYTQTLLAGNHLSMKADFLPSFLRELAKHKSERVCSICGFCFDCLMSEEHHLLDSGGDKPCKAPDLESSELSSCSVFSKCPSDASCTNFRASKSYGKTIRNDSLCSLSPECEKTCEGCKSCSAKKGTDDSLCNLYPDCEKICEGCKSSSANKGIKNSPCNLYPDCEQTCEGCKSSSAKKGMDNSLCNLYPDCEKTCEGCISSSAKRGMNNSLCSLYPDCMKTCEGCKNRRIKKKINNSLCSLYPDCEKTCDGCKNSSVEKKINNSLCSLYPDCEKTCEGCKSSSVKKKINISLCSLYPECKRTCEGCLPLKEPCTVLKDCPECLGCHKVCSEIAVCPNCEKCNVEELPEAKIEYCRRF